jgi:hypothetical protein
VCARTAESDERRQGARIVLEWVEEFTSRVLEANMRPGSRLGMRRLPLEAGVCTWLERMQRGAVGEVHSIDREITRVLDEFLEGKDAA